MKRCFLYGLKIRKLKSLLFCPSPHRCTLFSFYKNIEAQIWSEIIQKNKKNLKYDYENLPNETF